MFSGMGSMVCCCWSVVVVGGSGSDWVYNVCER